MNRKWGRRSAIALWLVRIGAVATIAWIVFLVWALFNAAFGADWTWHRDRAGLCSLVHARGYALIAPVDPVAAYQIAAASGAWALIALDYPEDPVRVAEIDRMVTAMTLDQLADAVERFCTPSPLGGDYDPS